MKILSKAKETFDATTTRSECICLIVIICLKFKINLLILLRKIYNLAYYLRDLLAQIN